MRTLVKYLSRNKQLKSVEKAQNTSTLTDVLVVADAASSAVCAGKRRVAYKSDVVQLRPPFVSFEGSV